VNLICPVLSERVSAPRLPSAPANRSEFGSRLLTEGLQRARSIGVGLYAPFLPSVVGCIAGQRWSICAARFSVHLPSNSRRWLRPTFACKRHQMRHLCDLTCLVAKQVLSQLSYTPTTVGRETKHSKFVFD